MFTIDLGREADRLLHTVSDKGWVFLLAIDTRPLCLSCLGCLLQEPGLFIFCFSFRYPWQLWRLKQKLCFGGKGNFPLQLDGLFLNGHYKEGCKECCLFPCKKEHRIFFLKDNIFVKNCKKVHIYIYIKCNYCIYTFLRAIRLWWVCNCHGGLTRGVFLCPGVARVPWNSNTRTILAPRKNTN